MLYEIFRDSGIGAYTQREIEYQKVRILCEEIAEQWKEYRTESRDEKVFIRHEISTNIQLIKMIEKGL